MEDVKIARLSLTTSRQDIFSTAVPEYKFRLILGIWLIGDGESSKTVDIEKKEEDGSYTMKFKGVPVPPAAMQPVPEGWKFDVNNPCMILEGGTNLTFKASGSGPEAVVIYRDRPPI